MDLDRFIAKWSESKLGERQGYQQHFLDICDLLGHPEPAEVDSEGAWFCFEYGASKQGGGEGWADVYKKDYFGWEYKGKHKDLDAAYRQLLEYRVSLRNPPLLIACDLDRFRIYTDFTNSENGCYEFQLTTLRDKSTHKPELTNFEVLRAAFEKPEALRIGRNPLHITEEAAASLGEIARMMQQRGVNPMSAAHFVMKLMFCLFAEDIKLLKDDPLTNLLDKTRNDVTRTQTNKWIGELLEVMRTGGHLHYERVPEFDGGLFDSSPPIPLLNGECKELETAAGHDWSRIEPAIFGTLLERFIDPRRQMQLGAHYTRPEEVMRVIEPVVLEPLREEWIGLRAELETLVGPRNPKLREKKVGDFLSRLCRLRILDPACGSGNFLYLALRAVMDLETEVRSYAIKHNILELTPERVGPEILLGREIDPFAKELASAVIWIGYIQKRLEDSAAYHDRPVLRPLESIVLADSILDEDGSRPEWPECDFIVGNPPFLGSKRMREALTDKYVERLFAAYDGAVAREADLCCYFHEQARQQIAAGRAKRAGLLATNSIRDVYSRGVLERINADTPIYEAWSDLEWVLDGANVRISIVCYGAPEQIPAQRVLDGNVVAQINSDLTTGLDLTKARRLKENRRLAFMGDLKVGKFELTGEQAQKMLDAKGNPNRRPNSDVILPWINGRMFLHPLWRRMFVIDFGTEMTEEDAAKYVKPFAWVLERVKPERDKCRMEKRRRLWWIHGSPATEMRVAIKDMPRFLATVRHTHMRVFLFFGGSLLPDSALIVFAIDDWYRFGVLQSRVHELWSLGLASDLRGWPRYTPTTTFETFPFPRISPHLRDRYPLAASVGGRPSPAPDPNGRAQGPAPTEEEAAALIAAVELAAKELYELRDNVVFHDPDCNSYTALYQQKPAWLQQAHAKLDRAVLACYGLPAAASKHDTLEFLLGENLARSG